MASSVELSKQHLDMDPTPRDFGPNSSHSTQGFWGYSLGCWRELQSHRPPALLFLTMPCPPTGHPDSHRPDSHLHCHQSFTVLAKSYLRISGYLAWGGVSVSTRPCGLLLGSELPDQMGEQRKKKPGMHSNNRPWEPQTQPPKTVGAGQG